MFKAREPKDATGWRMIPFGNGYMINHLGEIYSFKTNKKMIPNRTAGGYLRIQLSHQGTRKNLFIHHLVLEAFGHPKPFHDAQVCHRDGNRLNNRLSNLRWDTPKNNIADNRKNNTMPKGEKHGAAKLTQEQVEFIRKLFVHQSSDRKAGWPSNVTLTETAKVFGVSHSTISRIVQNKRWTEITRSIDGTVNTYRT